MGKKWIALVVMVVIAAALVVAALIYVRPGGVRVEVRFVTPEILNMSQSALRGVGLEKGGFEITLRDAKITVGTTLSPARLVTFAEFTEEEGVWLDGVFAKWQDLSEAERKDALGKITAIIRRSLTRHGGTLEEYMDERMGVLRADEEKKTEIEGFIRKLEWRNFPVRGVAVEYTPELIPCEPADNAPRRLIFRDPFDDPMRTWTLPHGAIEWGEPKRKPDEPETGNQKPDPEPKPE